MPKNAVVTLTADDIAMLSMAAKLLNENALGTFAQAIYSVLRRSGAEVEGPMPDTEGKPSRYEELTKDRKHLPTNVWFNGERLKLWLHRNDMTQKALAEKLDKHETTIGGWISGYARPSISVLDDLAEATDTHPSYWVDIQ